MQNPLTAYLNRNDITARAFAAKLDISRSQLSRILSGERMADAALLEKIERLTDGKVRPNMWVKWWRHSVEESV